MNKFIHGAGSSGQSLADRALAARHTVAGQSLAKIICKATTEEMMAPKRKHLDYLLQCTNEPNISIPQMANLLIDRTSNSSWVVVFKALVTVHNLLNYGNERFTQFLASNNCSFHLSTFSDRATPQGYEMSTFIRKYSKYLNEKAFSYRQVAFDFCKVKRGKEDGLLRQMNTEKLLKTLPALQTQLDTLIEFDVTSNDLSNSIITSAFMLMFKDLIRLFACYNDGIINLLEKYFDMNKKNCKDSLEIYKKFLARMERVCEFLKVAENIGIDKGDIPDLAKAPSSLLEALEQHLSSLENSKKTGATVNNKPTAGLSATISSFAAASQAANIQGSCSEGGGVSEDERRKILEEEEKQLESLKQQKLKQYSSNSPSKMAATTTTNKTVNNVSMVTQTTTKPVNNFSKNDPFMPIQPTTTTTTTTTTSSNLNDLLSLNDPISQQQNNLFSNQQQQNLFSSQFAFGSEQQQQQQQNSFNPFVEDVFAASFSQQQQQPQQQPQQQQTYNPFLPQQSFFPPIQQQQQQQPSLQQQQFFSQSSQSLFSNPPQQQQQITWTSNTTTTNSETTNKYSSFDLDFDKVFNSTSTNQSSINQSTINQVTYNDPFKSTQQQQQQQQQKPPKQQQQQQSFKLIQSDLDSSLASLAGNLNFSPIGQIKKTEHQWTNKDNDKKLTGGGGGGKAIGGWGFKTSFNQPTNQNWTNATHGYPGQIVPMGSQRSALMSPYQMSQSKPLSQASSHWGSTPHLLMNNSTTTTTTTTLNNNTTNNFFNQQQQNNDNNPFGLL